MAAAIAELKTLDYLRQQNVNAISKATSVFGQKWLLFDKDKYVSTAINDKIQYLQSLLQDFAIENWHIVPSLSEHYRMRAEFRIWHEGERISYAMFQAGQKAGRHSLIELTQFPVAAKASMI